jgi:hypothetical protein
VEITASSENAQIDCEGYLNWNAVWYELELPYEANVVDIVLQTEGPITNAGIVIMDDCNCDDFIGMSFEWIGANGWIHLWSNTVISGPDNNGTILYPLFIDPQQAYTVTFNVTELYVPSFNIYRDGSALESGITGNSYMDSDITEDVEYCYTCEQIMPDGGLSDMSNTACATPTGAVGGETMEDAIPIDALPYTAFGSTEYYLNDYVLVNTDLICPWIGYYSAAFSGAGADVVYSLTLADETYLTASLCGSGFDTGIGIFDGSGTQVLGSDDSCGLQSEVSCSLPAGLYYIVVDGWGTAFGDYTLNVSATSSDCTDDGFEDEVADTLRV